MWTRLHVAAQQQFFYKEHIEARISQGQQTPPLLSSFKHYKLLEEGQYTQIQDHHSRLIVHTETSRRPTQAITSYKDF